MYKYYAWRPSSLANLNSETEQIRPVSHGRQGCRSFLLIRKCLFKELRIVWIERAVSKKPPIPFPAFARRQNLERNLL